MSDFNLTNKVVQDNDMIQAINKLDRTTFKIFEMAVSCIDTNNPKQEVYLSKNDIFSFFELKSSDRYSRMEQSFKRLSQQGIVLEIPNERKKLINVTSTLEWGTEDSDDQVAVRFNADIMPYLVDLKFNFTQYHITEIKHLNSKYSLILFKWLMMKKNQRIDNPEITMIELRTMTDTMDQYQDFRNFDAKILKVAQNEINKNTTLIISYDKIARKGRKITSIKFNITPKDLSKTISVEETITKRNDDPYSDLYATFSYELDIELSESDKTLLRSLNEQYGNENLLNALRKAIIKGTSSLRYIEKSLKTHNF